MSDLDVDQLRAEVARFQALLPPVPGPGLVWRQGGKVGRNLYLHQPGDSRGRVVGQMQSDELAAYVVAATNNHASASQLRTTLTKISDLCGEFDDDPAQALAIVHEHLNAGPKDPEYGNRALPPAPLGELLLEVVRAHRLNGYPDQALVAELLTVVQPALDEAGSLAVGWLIINLITSAPEGTTVDRIEAGESGVEVDLSIANETFGRLAASAQALLDDEDAENGVELRFAPPGEEQPYTVTVYRPGGRTPGEVLLETRAELEEWKGRALAAEQDLEGAAP